MPEYVKMKRMNGRLVVLARDCSGAEFWIDDPMCYHTFTEPETGCVPLPDCPEPRTAVSDFNWALIQKTGWHITDDLNLAHEFLAVTGQLTAYRRFLRLKAAERISCPR